MSRLLIVLGAVLLVALAGLLAAPSLIDWNRYKEPVAEQLGRALGQPLAIEGELSASLLPRPTLSAGQVVLAAPPGSPAPHLARIERARVDVALAPLLRGRIQVASVRIERPDVHLERHPDGRLSWQPAPAGDAPVAGQDSGRRAGGLLHPEAEEAPALPGGDLDIRLDRLEVADGTLTYRDLANGRQVTVGDINARLAAGSLSGPFELSGQARLGDLPLGVDLKTGALGGDNAVPLSLTLSLPQGGHPDGDDTVAVSGLLSELSAGRTLRGTLSARSADPAALAARLAPLLGAAPPNLPSAPLALDGTLEIDPRKARLDSATLSLGEGESRVDGRLDGGLEWSGDVPRGTLRLAFTRLDLDTLLGATPGSGHKTGGTTAAKPAPSASPAADTAAPPADFSLPTNLALSAEVAVDALLWHGKPIRQVRLDAALADGEITLHQGAALLPAGADVTVFGFLGARDGQPHLDATVEATGANLSRLLDWLGVDTAPVPDDRLLGFTLSAGVAGGPQRLAVNNLRLRLDSTSLSGAMTLIPGPRPALGINLAVDRLDVDSYLPPSQPTANDQPTVGPTTEPTTDAGSPAPGTPSPADPGIAGPPLLAGLGVLNDLDANFKLSLERLTWRHQGFRDLAAEGSLVQGRLDLSQLTLTSEGAEASFHGGLSGFGAAPRFHDLAYALRSPRPEALVERLGLALPLPAERLAPLALAGTLNGSLAALTVDSHNELAGAVVRLNGSLSQLHRSPGFDLAVEASHASLEDLIGLFEPGYRAAEGPLGALALSTRAHGRPAAFDLDDLRLQAGPARLAGNLSVTLADGARPHLSGRLQAHELDLDRFRAAPRDTADNDTAPQGLLVPAAWKRPAPKADQVAQAAGGGRWSEAPIDLAALGRLDADLELAAVSLGLGGLTLGDAEITAHLSDATLDLTRIAGTLYGGQLSATARLKGARHSTLGTDFTLSDMDLARALVATGGRAGAGGRVDLSARLSTAGGSLADWVGGLGGDGELALKALEIRQEDEAGALAALGALNHLAGALGSGAGAGLASLSGPFTVNQGVVRFPGLDLASNLYTGELAGTADLVDWRIDAAGQAHLSQNLLTQLLASQVKVPRTVGIEIAGTLDDPERIRIDTGQATRQTPQQPAAPAASPEEQIIRGVLDNLLNR
ncbi:AsmA family protein [Roseospirillum parvum]|uniref:Uncharacterized protein involved in outer membrane biogenesis n=1 Tax=Roseospirillum parvum TaxID=83401 RepID=A0A1G8CRB6_9PROT|nr:AsmA family protein [Roseospirillum parvum]SDH47982.1 Uncharacterized protein involved in outer membrane biogenesis [Roseospirillum parvum]